jgi:SAM-dependent methyltransferase
MNNNRKTQVKCILCNSREVKYLFSPEDYYDIFSCLDCKTIFKYPQTSAEELKNLHSSSEYFNHEYFKSRRNSDFTKRSFKRIFDLVKTFCQKDSVGVLDIGCDTGTFLESIPDENISKVGIDLSEKAVEVAKSKGMNVICGDFLEIEFSQKYDIIIATDVWEHMHNPFEFLQKLKIVLGDGGVVYLTAPSSSSLICKVGAFCGRLGIMKDSILRLYPPFHLFYPSRKAFQETLKKEGFKILYLNNKKFYWEDLEISNYLIKGLVYFLNRIECLFNLSTVWEAVVTL